MAYPHGDWSVPIFHARPATIMQLERRLEGGVTPLATTAPTGTNVELWYAACTANRTHGAKVDTASNEIAVNVL